MWGSFVILDLLYWDFTRTKTDSSNVELSTWEVCSSGYQLFKSSRRKWKNVTWFQPDFREHLTAKSTVCFLLANVAWFGIPFWAFVSNIPFSHDRQRSFLAGRSVAESLYFIQCNCRISGLSIGSWVLFLAFPLKLCDLGQGTSPLSVSPCVKFGW